MIEQGTVSLYLHVFRDWSRVQTAKMALEKAKTGLNADPVDYEKIIDTLDQVSLLL